MTRLAAAGIQGPATAFMNVADGQSPCDADDVIITGELDRRPSRLPDHAAEAQAMTALAEAMSRDPGSVLQSLVEAAMTLTRADSAGISLLEPGGDQDTFRWVATAGAWAPYRDRTMPREDSPCGEVVARQAVLLMRHPDRLFPALLQADPGITEGLLAPFDLGGVPIGTVWAIKHDPDGRFEAEDARLLQSLARFASAAQQTVLALDAVIAAERARTTAMLDESESRMRAVFDAIDEGFVEMEMLMDDAGQVVDWRWLDFNPAFERMSGLVARRGQLFSEIVPDLEPEWAERYQQVVTTGETARFELPVGGLDSWFDAFVSRIGGEGSRRIAVIFTNITARKRAEQELRESEERQAFLLKLSDALRPLSDPAAVMAVAAEILGRHLGVGRAGYGEVDPTGAFMDVDSDWTDGQMASLAGRVRLLDFGVQVIEGFTRGDTVILHETQADERTRGAEQAFVQVGGTMAAIGVPLVKDGRLAAIFYVAQVEPRRWTPNEAELVKEVAERVSVAVAWARAEAAQRESEERFRALTETIDDVFYMTDLEANRLDYLSPSYARVWGRPVVELTDDLSRFADTVHPDDRARLAEGKAVQERGEPVTIEYRIVRPNGEERWILDRSFPVSNAAGRRSAGVASDITDRKAIEADRQAVEERLRLVLQSTLDYAIFTTDLEGRVVDWYAGAQTTFGYSPDEIRGQNIDLLYTPEDRASDAPEKEIIEARETGSAPNVRWHVRKGGGRVFIDGHVVPLRDPDGTLTGYLKIGQDVTERRRVEGHRREIERRFRTLAEGIPQLVWRAIDHGEWDWASPQWTTFTGQTNAESRGWGWLDVLHPEDRQIARDAWERSRTTDEYHAEYRIREAATGRYRYFQTRASPVHDENGRVIEWLGSSSDIDDLRSMQERQEVLVAELQHRTRNLIGVVRSTADKTARGSDDLVDFRTRFGDRLEALARVQGLLSRLNEHDRVTFDELIEAELTAMNGSAEHTVLEGPRGVRLRSSMVQTLAMALHELATNAVKYGALSQADGRLAVTWSLEPVGEDDRPWLHIDWRESGVVMPPPGSAPAGSGHGRELIERALPYQLNAKTTYALGPDGVHCALSIPVSASKDSWEAENA